METLLYIHDIVHTPSPSLGYKRVFLPLHKVADTPFHIQGDDIHALHFYYFKARPTKFSSDPSFKILNLCIRKYHCLRINNLLHPPWSQVVDTDDCHFDTPEESRAYCLNNHTGQIRLSQPELML